MAKELKLDPNRFFDPDPEVRKIARQLYEEVKGAPIVSPHGHVDPKLFADENARFENPTALFVVPDHYLFRMLYSKGVPLESLGIKRIDGKEVERDPRKIWQTFANNFYLFEGTPTGIWLSHELSEVFEIKKQLDTETAQETYDEINEKLETEEYSPRALFKKFKIKVLCTTDAAIDTLEYHKRIRGAHGLNIRPTFRPDNVVNNIHTKGWRDNIQKLREVSRIVIRDYGRYIEALKQRRQYFKEMGAIAIDCGVFKPRTKRLETKEARRIFTCGLQGKATKQDAEKFTAHMLMEMAEMSIEDGLVMQLHSGSYRNHNKQICERFGTDKGFDIPVQVNFTEGLENLLNEHGNNKRFRLILFTLDEDTYSRELAPLTAYPAVMLGPPWWFHDTVNGISRFLSRVAETAGIYNLVGFNDDTRAFCSIPARHDVWRRCCANWLANRVARHIIGLDEAKKQTHLLAYKLAEQAYNLN